MNVTIVIPTLNEEKNIGEVVEGFKKLGYDVLVIDGRSADRTREIAASKGAKVLIQSGKGKGQAVAEAFKIVDSDVLVLVDGDGSYDPQEVSKLLKPIEESLADHVVGNRFQNYEKGAFTRINLIGNKLLNMFFRISYGVDLRDILSGYRALRKEVYKSIELKKTGFEVETELTVETLAKGYNMVEVPITYRKRGGKTKLHPLKDGFRIGKTIYELISRYSPARYLYFFGFIFFILGFLSGLYVVYGWVKGVTHYLLANLTSLLIIVGIQMLIFGLIADYIFRTTIEIKRELRDIKRRS